MLVSHKYKFIFFKTKKSAGTSLRTFLQPYCFPTLDFERSKPASDEFIGESGIVAQDYHPLNDKKWKPHMPASQVKKYLSDDVWNDYLKFTVIRNSYAKVVSLYCWYHLHENIPDISFPEYVKDRVKKSVDWNVYTLADKPCCDFYIKYSNLYKDVEEVCKKLDLPEIDFSRFPHCHKREDEYKSDLYRSYYDEESKDIVYNVYKKEIDFFNFGF